MELAFSPALTEQTIIPAPSYGTVKVHFKATFVSRAALERARGENIAVEMWTNLPSGDSGSEWHALRFSYPANSLSEHDEHDRKVLALVAPVASQAPDRDRAMHLDLELRDVRPGSTFSFTYRLVHASGATEWLGSYGQNGTLAIQERDERLEVVAVKEREMLLADPREETCLAVVNRQFEWACWSFGENAWPTVSNTLTARPSKAVLLIPSKASRLPSVVVPQPLLFSVTSPDASLRVGADGRVLATQESSVFWSSLNRENAAIVLAHALPEASRVIDFTPDGAFATVVTRALSGTLPVAVSLIPLSATENVPHNVVLHIEDVQAALPAAQTSDVVLLDPSSQSFCFIDSHSPQDVVVRVGAAGGQVLLSPLHALTEAESEAWRLAVLSPTASVSVETRTVSDTSSPALPTPPPSPPPPGISLPRSPPEAAQAHVPLAMTSYQSFQALADASKVPDVIEPLTPTSPDQKILPLETEQSAEQQKDEKTTGQAEPEGTSAEPSQALTATPRPPPVSNGLLRFFFVWLIRALLARVWGLVGSGARVFGFESLLLALTAPRPTSNGQDAQQRASVLSAPADTLAQAPEPEATPADATGLPASDARSPDDEQAVIFPAVEVSEAPAPESVTVAPPPPEPEVVVHAHKPEPLIFAPTVLGAQPVKTLTQTRFLADVRSNVVSLLVHAPTSAHKPSNLAISVNEKRVENDVGYTCEQLSSDVYLLGLEGAEEGSTVEIALD